MRIFEIVARMRKMNLAEQRSFLQGEIRKEKEGSRSSRVGDLQHLLQQVTTKKIGAEVREEKRESRAA